MSPWPDTLPAIPLAQGVPVVNPASGQRGVVFDATVVCISLAERRLCRIALAPLDPTWRVDLDDPQGWHHALRCARNLHWGGNLQIAWNETRWRDLALGDEEATDADRLALAKALAEVVS
jgi:hypothetical protein